MNPNPTLHQNGVSAFVKSESFSRRIEFSVLLLVDIVFLFFSAWHREEIVCIYIYVCILRMRSVLILFQFRSNICGTKI